MEEPESQPEPQPEPQPQPEEPEPMPQQPQPEPQPQPKEPEPERQPQPEPQPQPVNQSLTIREYTKVFIKQINKYGLTKIQNSYPAISFVRPRVKMPPRGKPQIYVTEGVQLQNGGIHGVRLICPGRLGKTKHFQDGKSDFVVLGCFWIGARVNGTAKRPRYSPPKPLYVLITHPYELDSGPDTTPALYKLPATRMYMDATLSLGNDVYLDDVDKARVKFVKLLSQHHHTTSFWKCIETLGEPTPHKPKPGPGPRKTTKKKYHPRPRAPKRKPAPPQHHTEEVDLTVTTQQSDLSRQIQEQLMQATSAATSVIVAANAAAKRVTDAVAALANTPKSTTQLQRPQPVVQRPQPVVTQPVERPQPDRTPKRKRHRHRRRYDTSSSESPTPPRRSRYRRHSHHTRNRRHSYPTPNQQHYSYPTPNMTYGVTQPCMYPPQMGGMGVPRVNMNVMPVNPMFGVIPMNMNLSMGFQQNW